jgi:histidinol phosphatase-like enzyme
VDISNTTKIMDRATDMAAPENMEAEQLQAPESTPTPQTDEKCLMGVEAAPSVEEDGVLETTTDTTSKRSHKERRRTLSNEILPMSWNRLGNRMETPQETQPVR